MYHKTGAFVTPGDCFEQPKSMRIGYAYGKDALVKGLKAERVLCVEGKGWKNGHHPRHRTGGYPEGIHRDRGAPRRRNASTPGKSAGTGPRVADGIP